MKITVLSIILFLLVQHQLFSQKIEENSALIILDIQKYYTENILTNENAETLINKINKLQNEPAFSEVIYVQSVLQELSVSFKGINIDTLPNLDFDDRLQIKSKNTFTKTKASAFTNEELTSFLETKNVEHVYVVGLMGEQCVYYTSMGGLKENFKVHLIKDALAIKNQKTFDKKCQKMKKAGVLIE